MKKKILSLAIIAAAFNAFNGVAQTNDNNNAKAVCVAQQCGKPGKGCPKEACPFDGLNITDAQKAQLQQLNASRREARKAQAATQKADRQRNDSARMAQRRADKKEYLEQVKAIIGPDQYVVFLENFYVNGGGQQRPGGKAMIGQGRMAKAHGMRQGDRKINGKRGDRPFKAQAKAAKAQAAPTAAN